MKIVHSWLNDLAPIGDDTAAIAAALTSLGLQVEDIDTVGASVPGVITARVLRTERHEDAAKVHRVFVDAGDGVERHVVRRVQHVRRRRRPAGDARHGDARRPGDRAEADPRDLQRRDALLGASSGSATTTAASTCSRPTRRSACRTARRCA